MKKILFALLFTIFFIPKVDAESFYALSETQKELYNKSTLEHIYYNNNSTYYQCSGYLECYQKALELFNASGKQYYYITIDIDPVSFSTFMVLYTFDFLSTDYYYTTNSPQYSRLYFTIDDTNYVIISGSTASGGVPQVTYMLYDTNFNFIASDNFVFSNFYSTNESDNLIVSTGDSYPLFKNLIQYDSFNSYRNDFNNIKEVNLDNYEYVILNLKDYSSTKAFETNLQVKGSIAITPVYEFGTVEKETITDVCNASYSDFTDYRFFILKNDLINNAVYIVKNCQESSSSFRYDSSIFDITYVTDENVDDPVITFGGVEYHTIPFNKLSNTVNKNEEEGYIPGASEQFDPFGSIGDYISSFWNTLTTLMGLVTKFFNTLPVEIRAVSITMFITAITLGVIKFIKS